MKILKSFSNTALRFSELHKLVPNDKCLPIFIANKEIKVFSNFVL